MSDDFTARDLIELIVLTVFLIVIGYLVGLVFLGYLWYHVTPFEDALIAVLLLIALRYGRRTTTKK